MKDSDLTRCVAALFVGESGHLRPAKQRLERCGPIDIQWASITDVALLLLGRFTFDVVIVAGELAALYRRVRRLRDEFPQVPILALPPRNAEYELIVRLFELGATGCISPEISGRELRDAISAASNHGPSPPSGAFRLPRIGQTLDFVGFGDSCVVASTAGRTSGHGPVERSRPMRYVTVLLLGEGEDLRQARRQLDYPEYFGAHTAASIKEGLSVLSKSSLDVVIVGGPLAQLLDTIIQVRDRSPNVPILVLPRRDAGPELVRHMLELGAARCLQPAMSGPELRAAVLASCA